MITKDYFDGFIDGLVACYNIAYSLDKNLRMEWSYKLDGSQTTITCEYTYYLADRLIRAGDYDNEPEYQEINERTQLSVTIHSKMRNSEIADLITNEILEKLVTVDPINYGI